MKHVKLIGLDLPDIWWKAMSAVWFDGDDFKVEYGSEETLTKKLSVTLEILHPENRPLISDKAPNDMTYVNEYALRYLWGLDGDSEFGKKPLEHYTYACRMRNPVDQTMEVMKRLADCPVDRQLTINIPLPDDIIKQRHIEGEMERFEPPCLRLIDLDVNKEEGVYVVCPTIYFRSWDEPAGLPVNLAGIQLWTEALVHGANELSRLDLKDQTFRTGKMIAHSKNLHIYVREFTYVEELRKRIVDSRNMSEKIRREDGNANKSTEAQ